MAIDTIVDPFPYARVLNVGGYASGDWELF